MKVNFRFSIVLFILAPMSLLSQVPEIVLYFPIQSKHIKIGAATRKLLKNNTVDKDSLTRFINSTLLNILDKEFEEEIIVLNDSLILHSVDTGTVLKRIFTSDHLEKIQSSKGFVQVSHYNNNTPDVRFTGRMFPQEISSMIQTELLSRNTKYLILINEVEIKDGINGFIIHYEIYNKSFTRIYGNKYIHFMDVGKKMYYSTFVFYLKYCFEGFNKQLNSVLKKVN